jgi:hypothetical protein
MRVVCFILFSVMALAAFPARAAAPDQGLQQKLNGGYYLLHHLCEDEDQVPMLFVMKHAPDEISAYAKEVSRTAKESLSTLDHFQDQDSAIAFDQNPLPPIEREARASIEDDKQHQLLFGTKDAEFVRAFLVSQIEACSYALHLAKVLGNQETDPERIQGLRQISAQWLHRREDAFRLLRNY